jgi:hypothetical protein
LQNQARRDFSCNEYLNARLVPFLRKEAIEEEATEKEDDNNEEDKKAWPSRSSNVEKEAAKKKDDDHEEDQQAWPSRSTNDEKKAAKKVVAEKVDDDDEEDQQAWPSGSSDNDDPISPIRFPRVMRWLKYPICLNYCMSTRMVCSSTSKASSRIKCHHPTWSNNISIFLGCFICSHE